MDKAGLIEMALLARERAYAPYSGFRVGAALLSTSGKVYTGCNVENASYGLTICAERTAVVKAVSEGERSFSALALVGSQKGFVYPCGACLQVLAEFAPTLQIISVDAHGNSRLTSLDVLLPEAFALNNGEGTDGN